MASEDFFFRLRRNGKWIDVLPAEGEVTPVLLGESELKTVQEQDMSCMFWVGNWNNLMFPHYPKWFFEEHPEVAALDQHGNRFRGGFGEYSEGKLGPGVESPIIVNGTRRFMEAAVERYAPNPAALYWTLGGEVFHATFLEPQRWSDYSTASLAHFRQWLRARRYGKIGSLNESETRF